ncbi:MAG: DEAD/DEAH box helicase family protein [Balneolaceae bacterium]|nr:DEAD/DEAH box helicase family protein [Balneolaceae bacterium]
MPSNKETLFQEHICSFLEEEHGYQRLHREDLEDIENHVIEDHLLSFVQVTQPNKYEQLVTDFGSDADNEIIKALRNTVADKALWLIMRDGIDVRGIRFELYKPKPRSKTSPVQWTNYRQNNFSFKKEYAYNPNTDEKIDLVLFLNGLPIIVIELKHEDEGRTCEDAVYESYLTRDLENDIYTLPFLYIASSNTEVKVATDPSSPDNFLWFNAALENRAQTEDEYPVEHLYKKALSKENIAKYLEQFLVFVPAKETITEDGELITKPSKTIFPRYHQLRASRKLGKEVLRHFEDEDKLGESYLINHSAGSGKTLTIAWMSDVLDSLYHSGTNEKIFDNIIVLTDRRNLDKNVKDDLEKFSHLRHKVHFTDRSSDLANYLESDKDIIVTTIHKFSYIQEKLDEQEALQGRRVAFLIDEAHRSQEGKMAHTMRDYFSEENEDDPSDEVTEIDDSNQVFVAFTATTTPQTAALFGEPFDVYSEEEAIKEGYILDVAQNIISYETLYNLQALDVIPDDVDFPAGTISKALRNIAFEDDSLLQYKSEVIINLFEDKVEETINGKGKAMVVANSRVAGLKYYEYINEIIQARDLPYNILYAFSDFTHPETHEEISEGKLNELQAKHSGKDIDEVFDQDEYRIIVVANKFQTGFDQPLLSAMFLDKVVKGENAVQTVSRLNRQHPEKEQSDILVVDFTNNASEIFEAFNKHRKGSPYKHQEPDPQVLQEVYDEVYSFEVFSKEQIENYIEQYRETEEKAKKGDSSADTVLSNLNQEFREVFKTELPAVEDQKRYISLLNRYTNLYYFIGQFFSFPEHLKNFIVFAEGMATVLERKGKTTDLKKHLQDIDLKKGAVNYLGIKTNLSLAKEGGSKTGISIRSEGEGPPRKTIDQAIKDIKEKYPITDEEALVIKEICEEVSGKQQIKTRIINNKKNELFLRNYQPTVQNEVKQGYIERELWQKLNDPMYTGKGGIINLMGKSIINRILNRAS